LTGQNLSESSVTLCFQSKGKSATVCKISVFLTVISRYALLIDTAKVWLRSPLLMCMTKVSVVSMLNMSLALDGFKFRSEFVLLLCRSNMGWPLPISFQYRGTVSLSSLCSHLHHISDYATRLVSSTSQQRRIEGGPTILVT